MRIVAENSQDRYLFTDVNQVEGVSTTYPDITDLEAIRQMVAENRVDAIVNCAAYTNGCCRRQPSVGGKAQCRSSGESSQGNERGNLIA